MRLRKPCSLARWRFLGWKVGLPISCLEAPSARCQDDRTATDLAQDEMAYERRSTPTRAELYPWTRNHPFRGQFMADFQAPGSATIDDFHKIDMRVGRIISAEPFPRARVPAYRLTLDFGPYGTRRSSARLPLTYPDPQALIGRL